MPAASRRAFRCHRQTCRHLEGPKAASRKAFRQRRCLIVADGFCEWKKLNGKKHPYCRGLRDDRPFTFAGLWERWNRGDSPINSSTILTTVACARYPVRPSSKPSAPASPQW
jgi:putative SOS response-associated peptidase YedK